MYLNIDDFRKSREEICWLAELISELYPQADSARSGDDRSQNLEP